MRLKYKSETFYKTLNQQQKRKNIHTTTQANIMKTVHEIFTSLIKDNDSSKKEKLSKDKKKRKLSMRQ